MSEKLSDADKMDLMMDASIILQSSTEAYIHLNPGLKRTAHGETFITLINAYMIGYTLPCLDRPMEYVLERANFLGNSILYNANESGVKLEIQEYYKAAIGRHLDFIEQALAEREKILETMCKQCGATIPEGSGFCPTCGEKQVSKST